MWSGALATVSPVNRRLTTALATCAAVAAAGALAPAAGAQTQGPAPVAERPPHLVISHRAVRMSLAGTAAVRIGCFTDVQEFCAGTVQLRLARTVTAPGIPAPRTRRVAPFTFATARFGLGGGNARLVFFRVLPRARFLVRQVGEIPVNVIASYAGRSGQRFLDQREIRLYVPSIFVF